MSAVAVTVSGGVPGYHSLVTSWVPSDARCLSHVAELSVLLVDGARITLHLDSATRWSATVTPELRAAVRDTLVALQDAEIATHAARQAVAA